MSEADQFAADSYEWPVAFSYNTPDMGSELQEGEFGCFPLCTLDTARLSTCVTNTAETRQFVQMFVLWPHAAVETIR